MNKRGTGAIFVLVGGLIFAARYIAAAIFMSSIDSWNAEMFSAALQYVGVTPLTVSIVFFLLGALFIVWQEIDEKKGDKKKEGK